MTAARTEQEPRQWASLRIAPDHAWPHTRGAGVLVAVVDSGADASLPELAGHVTAGADLVAGTGRGDTDCLGSGTAMAGVIGARARQGSPALGVAPDATIMPIRVVTDDPHARPQDQAAAIQVAVSAGAGVVALGSYVDPAVPPVAAAIAMAAQHNIVVVMGAATGTAGTPRAPHLLRVGGIDIGGGWTARYVPGAVDVVAPGTDVISLGISGTPNYSGTGTQYAVAFVTGEAALVRAKYPRLTAAQVVHRIEVTAAAVGTAHDPSRGQGLIDPTAAVTRTVPEEEPATRSPTANASLGSRPGTYTAALGMTVAVVFLMMVLLVLRIRRILRRSPGHSAGEAASGSGHRAPP
jgi:subtilisin family serine protease